MRAILAAAALVLLRTAPAIAGDSSAPADSPPEESVTATTAESKALLPAVGGELERYGRDSLGLLTAPLSWERRDWEKAAAFAVILGALFATDRSTYRESQETRSHFTNSVARATMPFGAEYGFGVSAALIAGGLAFDRSEIRDTGRDALEAGVIAGLIDNLVIKRATGRLRPVTSNGQTVFEPGSSNASFASGHATEAFAVASVVAARSPGWVIPGIAYTLATLVAADRVNVKAHFVSDVFAGAVLGTVTGRWLVHRHEAQSVAIPRAELEIGPTAHGIAAKLRF
jgi:hypothetical protein